MGSDEGPIVTLDKQGVTGEFSIHGTHVKCKKLPCPPVCEMFRCDSRLAPGVDAAVKDY